MKSFSTRILSLLLTLVMIFSIMPSALAVDEVTEEHIHTEEITETESISTSGYILGSNVYWEVSGGQLLISGSGSCPTFTSAADQPWAHLRDEITAVWFNSMDALAISNLAYWFDGCTALTSAEIPYTTSTIGTRAFAECPNLTDIRFYYYDSDTFTIAPGAFYISQPTQTNVHLITEQQYAVFAVADYDWASDNRETQFYDVYTAVKLGNCHISGCSCDSCSTTNSVYGKNDSEHAVYVACTGCGVQFWLYDEGHSYSGGYCSSCGAKEPYVAPSCSHSSYYTNWSGCYWTDYCSSCGDELDSGYSHSYSYGSWKYYSTSQHRRTGTCSCGDTTYSYGSHSTSTKYSQYGETQHQYGSYCSTCASYVGTASYANHSLTYGSWTTTDTQHSRTKSCSLCGYSGTESGDHTDTDSNGSCDTCLYLMSRFSVTVPTSMTLTVSESGEVYAAETAVIVNNSSAAVSVTSVSLTAENGWTLVPYTTNMADTKMDAKLIGFSINGAQSTGSGASENLAISGWTIARGNSLALSYDAVVSGSRTPINEQVLTVVFVLNWAA